MIVDGGEALFAVVQRGDREGGVAREFEIIGDGALGAFQQRKARDAPPEGTACANEETP